MESVGVWSYQRLVDELGRARVRRAVTLGSLSRIARGWYASAAADPEVVRAVRLGGQLGCISAARRHGLWVPPATGIHVCRRRVASETPVEDGVVFHCVRRIGAGVPIAPARSALEQVVRFHDLELAVCLAESAIEQQRLSVAQALQIVAARHGIATAARFVQAGPQSGTESRVKFWLKSQRYSVRQQVFIDRVGRVDLLVGRRLVIEADSRAHHSLPADYHRDRQRDLALIEQGYECIRLSYEQVWFDWPATQETLRAVLRTRRHLTDPSAIGQKRSRSSLRRTYMRLTPDS